MMGLYRYANGGSSIAPTMNYPAPAPTSGVAPPQSPFPSPLPGGTLGYTGQGIGSYTQQPPAYTAQPQQQGAFNPGAYPAFANPQFGQQQPLPTMPNTQPSQQPPQYARGGLVDAAHKLRGAGRYGDTELVHVNGVERDMMRQMFGPETRNPQTGLPEHFSFSKILGLAAPFANLIPGAGPFISAGLSAASAATAGGGKKGAAAAPTPAQLAMQNPLTIKALNREKTPLPEGFDPFSYGQKAGEFNFFRQKEGTSAPGMTPTNWGAYMTANPDVMAEYNKILAAGEEGRNLLARLNIGNADQFGQYHWNTKGKDENRKAFANGGEADYDDDDTVAHLMAYRRGDGHDGPGHVRGIGGGQEDKIPAWLSDGEYVWSAQDVSDLGDGSTDEGVRRLDQMRQMVRKQAGRRDVKKIAKPQRGIDVMLKAVGGSV